LLQTLSLHDALPICIRTPIPTRNQQQRQRIQKHPISFIDNQCPYISHSSIYRYPKHTTLRSLPYPCISRKHPVCLWICKFKVRKILTLNRYICRLSLVSTKCEE